MDKLETINFFSRKEKIYNKDISTFNLILLSIIVGMFIFNGIKVHKVRKLESYIKERKNTLNSLTVDNKTSTNQMKTSEIYNVLDLIHNNEIESIEIKNNKLDFKGKTSDPAKINSYLESIKNIDNTSNANVDFINNEENLYEFEITSYMGVKNES